MSKFSLFITFVFLLTVVMSGCGDYNEFDESDADAESDDYALETYEEDSFNSGLTPDELAWKIRLKKMKEKAEEEGPSSPFSQSGEEPSPSGGDTIMDELDGDEEDAFQNGLTGSRLEWLIHIKKMKEKAEEGEEEENPFSQSGEELSPSGGDFGDEADNGFSPGISSSKSEWENFVKQLKEEEREENGE